MTEKLDPIILDVDTVIAERFAKGKKNNGMQITSKTANKYIMMTYAKSIEKIGRNTSIL